MKRLLMSAAIAALAVPAFAQDTTTPETATDEAVQVTDEAADAAADAAGDAADAAGDAAEAAGDAADATAEAAGEAADAAADAAVDAGAAAEAEMDAEADAADAEAEADAAADATAEMPADATADMPADAATTEEVAEEVVEEPVVAPVEAQPELDTSTPSMLGSWVQGLQVYTTNQPSDAEWSVLEGDAIPEEWDSIADIGDIVIDEVNGEYIVAGYVVDIGGFLGIGAKEVVLSTDALRLGTFGSDVIFATNYTREELGALPDFDDSMMLPATLTPAEPAADATMAPADPAAAPADPAAAPADPAADPAAAPADPAAAPAEGEAAPASN